MKRFIALGILMLLAACGQVAPLRPQAGASLPPKPDTAEATPTSDDLLRPSDQSRPKRNDELLRNSEKRKSDRFDLPPSG
jgi:hypothetical protein